MASAAEAVSSSIIQLIQGDDDAFNAIGGRVFHTEPSALRDEELPLVAFRFLPGRNLDKVTQRLKSFPVLVMVFSSKSTAESLRIYDTVKEAVKNQYHTVDSIVSAEFDEDSTPSTNFDPESGDFIATATWRIKAVEPEE